MPSRAAALPDPGLRTVPLRPVHPTEPGCPRGSHPSNLGTAVALGASERGAAECSAQAISGNPALSLDPAPPLADPTGVPSPWVKADPHPHSDSEVAAGPVAVNRDRRTVRKMIENTTPHVPAASHAIVAPGTCFAKADAATLCGVHPDTIKRALKAGKFRRAAKDDTGLQTWRIPVEDLVAAGMLPADRVGERIAELEKLRESDKVFALREQIADRDATIARLNAELEAARREADRLDAARADADANLKLALRLATKAA